MSTTTSGGRPPKLAIAALKNDLDEFRTAVRGWFEATVAPDWMEQMKDASPEQFARLQRSWYAELCAAGLATAHWPKQWGGEELPLAHQVVVYQEMARANAPTPSMYVISLYHVPATLFAHGSPAQRERYLSGVKERGEVWCQGFSEPNAGSDLASLRTRAERRGDVYVVNGQKIWSSFCMHADYCLLLARTDPGAAKKHLGISYFIMDMRSPGITRRAIRQSTGQQEFGELFLDNVEIPSENLIGGENQGWQIAQSTLSTERGLLLFEMSERTAQSFERDLTLARKGRAAWWRDDQLRREFLGMYAAMQGVSELVRRMLAEIEAQPTTAGSELPLIIKAHFSELLQRYAEWHVRIGGILAQVERPGVSGAGFHTGNAMFDYLHSFALTISGGTNEIIKNLIAERILKLPRIPSAV